MSTQQTSSSAQALTVTVTLAEASLDWGAPTITITVNNTSLTEPYTFLKWSSPLDPLVLQLGLLDITSADGTKLDLPTIMVNRLLPPSYDDLVTLQPGESKSQDVVLQDPVVPKHKAFPAGNEREQGKKATVVCKGSWRGVWPGKRTEEVSKEQLRNGSGGYGDFESDALDLVEGHWQN